MIDSQNSLFWRSLSYAFLVFFVTFPFIQFATFLYGGTSTRSLTLILFTTVSVFVLVGVMIVDWTKKGAPVSLPKSPAALALVVYAGLLGVSGISGLDFSTTFWSVATRTTGLWYFISLGLFMAMLWVVIRDVLFRERLILGVVISSALYSLLYLAGPQGFGVIFAGAKQEAFTFGNTSFAAMYIFGAFLLALYYAYQAEQRVWWHYVLPVLVACNPSIINPRVFLGDFSGGVIGAARATSVAVALSVVALCGVWLIARMRNAQVRRRAVYALYGAGLLVAALASVSLLMPGGYVRDVYLSEATAARPLVWEISAKAISERPWLGWGSDNFERVFEKHFDNRLLQANYGNEAWFDRAHNVYIDQLLDNGILGLVAYLLVYLVTTLGLVYATLHAQEAKDRALAAVLLVYFALHLAELQTAFDTSISYPMLALLFVLAVSVVHKTMYGDSSVGYIALPTGVKYVLAVGLMGYFGWSSVVGTLPFIRAQVANGAVRTVGSAERRIPYYPVLFGSPLDVQAFIWRTATDFQRGIGEDPSVLEDPAKVKWLAEEVVVYEEQYKTYLKDNPTNFRAHLNLADVLMYQVLFGKRKLEEARAVLDDANELVPQSPLPYWMKTVSYVYEGKFALARETAKAGIALNPNIKRSHDIAAYVERSAKSFPEIDLYFFNQI